MRRPTDERQIRRQFDRLAECIGKTENETPAMMALKMNRLGRLFAPTVEVQLHDFPENGSFSSSELCSHVSRLRPMFAAITLSLYDLRITLRSHDQAEAVVTVRLTLTPRHGEPATQTWELAVEMTKSGDDGHWRFSRCRENEVMVR